MCSNIKYTECCFKQGKVWNSVKVVPPFGCNGYIEPYRQQGTNYCAITLNEDFGPRCYDDTELLRIEGAVWYENPEQGGIGRKKRDTGRTQTEADVMFLMIDGVEYRLDVDSVDGSKYEGLEFRSEKVAFIKEHGSPKS